MKYLLYLAKKFEKLLQWVPVRSSILLSSATLSFLSACCEGIAFSLLVSLVKQMLEKVGPPIVKSSSQNHSWLSSLQDQIATLNLPSLALLIVVFLFLKAAFVYFAEKLLGQEQQNQLKNLRERTFNSIIYFKKIHSDSYASGKLQTILLQETAKISGALALSRQMIQNFSYLLAYSLLLFYLIPTLALASFLLFPFIFILSNYMERKLKKQLLAETSKSNDLNKSLFETINVFPLVRLFMTQKIEQARFKALASNACDLEIEIAKNRAKIQTALQISSLLLPLGVILLAHLLNRWQLFQFSSEIMVFFLALQRASHSYIQLLSYKTRLLNLKSSFKEINKVLNPPPQCLENDRDSGLNFPRAFNTLELHQLGFSYQDRKPIFGNLSLTLRPGDRLIIQGESGVGKSTLGSLISRLYDPSQGKITLNQIPASSFAIKSWREAVIFHTQEIYFHSSSIADCLSYGLASISAAEMWQALKIVELSDFVTSSSLGLGTPVGLNGISLSAGQRQRLALARIVLREPQVLILDEALTNVPYEVSMRIYHSLSRTLSNSALIFISHYDLKELGPTQILRLTRDGLKPHEEIQSQQAA